MAVFFYFIVGSIDIVGCIAELNEVLKYSRYIIFVIMANFAYRVGTFGAIAEYGAEKKVSHHSSVSAAVMVGVPTGVMLKLK